MQAPSAPRPATPRDLLFLATPALWPTWPYLPVIRRTPDGEEDCGVLYDCWSVARRPGFSATIFLCNIFLLPPTEDEFFALPKEVFDTVDEIAAGGLARGLKRPHFSPAVWSVPSSVSDAKGGCHVIEIPRSRARLLRAVLRKSVVEQEPRGEWPLLLCQADQGGLRLFAQRGEIGVSCHTSGALPTARLAFRASVLEQFEGRSEATVQLAEVKSGQGEARWTEGTEPRLVVFDTVMPESVPTLPDLPTTWTTLPAGFLAAFDEAVQSTAKESGRFALSRVQLRGQAGEVVASDGKQLLVQSGFPFPWTEDVLVPRLRAFGLRELATEGPVRIAKLEQQVVVSTGSWTFYLRTDVKSRFPEIREVIPRAAAITCRLRLDPADAVFLVKTLPHLPAQEDEHSPVTLDLSDRALLRARSSKGGMTTEVELKHSRVEGKPARINLDRTLLRRALLLGCTDLGITTSDKPILTRNSSRIYVFMPLDAKGVIPPCKQALEIASSAPGESTTEPTNPRRTRMSLPHSHGHDAREASEAGANRERGPGIAELVTEAEELRNHLQEASTRLSRLLAGLKQHRSQSRAMRAAMQSLRQLKLED